MIANHVFKSTWYYKVFLTEKLVDIMKNENNLSVYELLGKNSFPVDNFFMLHYLLMMSLTLTNR